MPKPRHYRRPALHLVGGVALAVTLLPVAPAAAAVAILGPSRLLVGETPHLRVTGLAPRTEVTVESFRISPVSIQVEGKWSVQPKTFHAQARFWTDDQGALDLDTARPLSGTYNGADPRGLLWSGAVVGRAPEPDLSPGAPEIAHLDEHDVRLRVVAQGEVLASRDLTLLPWTDRVAFTEIDRPGLVGVFAAPKGARRARAVILLHGSEGGDFASAKAVAGLWASHGYAAFALIYFAWPASHIPNAPQGFTQLPVEGLAQAHDWLEHRPEADARRLGVVGGSKGAEFALIGASLYPWISAVTACVPSSIVWGGFGGPSGQHPDSFTYGGVPLASVPYGDYGPVARGEITSAERHVRDRAAADAALIAKAAIPVEKSRARILLISGGRDAVWPSDAMSAEIAGRLARHGGAWRVTWISNPDAGHYLCGTGDSPIRWNEADEKSLGGGLVASDGRDPGRAWTRTLAFMRRNLGPPARRISGRRQTATD
jgi:dienelactone hydrolase